MLAVLLAAKHVVFRHSLFVISGMQGCVPLLRCILIFDMDIDLAQ